MKSIIVGLGNPGVEYETTYHNVGRLALHALAEYLAKDDLSRLKRHDNLFEYASADTLSFVMPLTFMNESGVAAREAMKKFAGKPENVVVLHDDSDLLVGNYKISVGQNAAGHKGVQSIMDALHSKKFTRVRIGIRPQKETRRKKASEFVLKTISKKDLAVFDLVFAEIAGKLADAFI